MSRILCRISGAPRSASAIANGHSGSAGHAIADKCSGSTNRGDCNNGKKNAVSYLHKRHVKNSVHNKYSEIHQKQNAQFYTLSKTNPLRNWLSLSPSSKKPAYQKSHTSKSLSDPWSPWWSNITQDNVLIGCDPYIKFILFNHTP